MTENLQRFDDIQVGDQIASLELPPISRHTLALYCGASGDHNPIHVDSDFAKSAGMPDVFAHGMLSMAWLGRLLTNWIPQEAIRSFGVRFVSITQIHDQITCKAEVTEKFTIGNENRVRLALSTCDQQGQIKLSGDAVIALQ